MLRHHVLGTTLMTKRNAAPSGGEPDLGAILKHTIDEIREIMAALKTYETEVESDRRLDQLRLVEEMEAAWNGGRPRSKMTSKRDLGHDDMAEAWGSGLRPDMPAETRPTNWTDLVRTRIKESADHLVVFDALCLHASLLIAQGFSLPDPLRRFACDVLTSQRSHPRPTSESIGMELRNGLLVELIERLSRTYGMRPTRNDATAGKLSACDIVAQAMAELRVGPSSYSSIKKIWITRSEKTEEE